MQTMLEIIGGIFGILTVIGASFGSYYGIKFMGERNLEKITEEQAARESLRTEMLALHANHTKEQKEIKEDVVKLFDKTNEKIEKSITFAIENLGKSYREVLELSKENAESKIEVIRVGMNARLDGLEKEFDSTTIYDKQFKQDLNTTLFNMNGTITAMDKTLVHLITVMEIINPTTKIR